MSARDEGKPRLTGIYIESGVSHRTREPFCRVSVQGVTEPPPGVTSVIVELVGQLPPEAVRAMALGFLEAAEGAIHDASVLALLIDDVGLDVRMSAHFVGLLRAKRADAHTMTDPPDQEDDPDA